MNICFNVREFQKIVLKLPYLYHIRSYGSLKLFHYFTFIVRASFLYNLCSKRKMDLDVGIKQIIFCRNNGSNIIFWNPILVENALKISKIASELI